MSDPFTISKNDTIQIIIADNDVSFKKDESESINIYIGRTLDLKHKIKDYYSSLSQDEKARAERFKIPSIRDTFVLCHGYLRQLLAEKLDLEAAKIPIVIDAYGKPTLRDHSIYFNISHSKDVFAIALSDSTEVGVDIEKINQGMKYEGIIKSYFHPNEINKIKAQKTKAEKINLFYTYWTRKEAFLKAVGVGLVNSLYAIDMSGQIKEIDPKYFPYELLEERVEFFIYSKMLDSAWISIATSMPTLFDIRGIDDSGAYLL